MIDMGHNAKLTSGICLVLSQHHYVRENFTSIQTKKNKSHHCCEMMENQSVVEVWMKQAK